MSKCSMCDKDADIISEGKYFCMEHFHIWGMRQPTLVDWEIVENDSD